jgi:MFS family permease
MIVFVTFLLTSVQDLDVSISLATLTVTIYMIVQGVAPSFWGSLSDVLGRRVIFIGTFGVYIISNIALAVSTNYGELMAFRALQAAGSAATISIGIRYSLSMIKIHSNIIRCRCHW